MQDETIRIVQYTPHETFNRKVAIDEILKDMREKEPNLRTQVRPGFSDWEIRMKKASRFEYDNWDVLKPEDIDANGRIPKMVIIHSKDDPKIQEFIRNKTKQVDEDGFKKVESKRKASSPRNNEAKRSQKTPDNQISIHVRQVLVRNCNRPANTVNDSVSSTNTSMEDAINDGDYDNTSLEEISDVNREPGKENQAALNPTNLV